MNEKVMEKLINPLPGSKIAKAKEFGVDLTLLVENLRKTPQERINDLQSAMRFIDEIQRAGELARKADKTQ